MRANWFVTAFAATVLSGAGVLPAQTTSELLQKGIYTQETLGDLDGAIKIYTQGAQMAKESRVNAAQAQYRLGVCLLKKGRKAEAAKAFQGLIDDYPDQAETVAKARAMLPSDAGLKLLPAPWSDGEVMELQMKMANGRTAGFMRYSVQASKSGPDRWIFDCQTSNPMLRFGTRSEVDRETMKPVASAYLNYPGGDAQITYQGREARVERAGKDPKTLTFEGQAWDNESVVWLMRRLPLAPGFKMPLTIVTGAGVSVTLNLSVSGVEDVQTAAGSFHCYRVELDTVNQAFFISADASRHLVKFDTGAGMVIAELRGVVRSGASEGAGPYRNDKFGISLVLPAGWNVDDYGAMYGKDSSVVQLMDPETLAVITLVGSPAKSEDPATAAGMRAAAEKMLADQDVKKLRADSWQTRQVGGRPAVGWLADSADMFGNKTVEYTVQVRGESSRALFSATIAAKNIEALRACLDPIINSLMLK